MAKSRSRHERCMGGLHPGFARSGEISKEPIGRFNREPALTTCQDEGSVLLACNNICILSLLWRALRLRLMGVGEKRGDYHCLHFHSSRPKWNYYSELAILLLNQDCLED